jgi:CheY-like chemotaxis protein
MGGTRKKVLWVDDEIEFLRAHIMFLETRGYSVIPVFNGIDALEILHDQPDEFDIVLLDEQMPGKDGLTTLEEIKEFLPDLPVVMVTKSEEEQLMEDALGRKIDGYLTKPVNPSQILSVCKKLLDARDIISSQVSQRFARHFSDNKMSLSRSLSTGEWNRLYNNFTYWDIELESVQDEGLRQNHAGQKSDANRAFGGFISDSYAGWVRDRSRGPLMSPEVVKTYVAPLLQKNERVYFVVLDCMRLDQYYAIESILRKHFDIQRYCYFSVLPTTTLFARNSLLSGMFPGEFARKYPDILGDLNKDDRGLNGHERDMLVENLKNCGVDIGGACTVSAAGDAGSASAILENLPALSSGRLVTLMFTFMDMLAQGHSTSDLVKEMAPDESAFRAITQSWFQYSSLYQILRELARQEATVVLTTDHGSVLCSRGTELYGAPDFRPTVRCRYGENITSDERNVLFVPAPEQFKLPAAPETHAWLIARENFYFVHPERFEDYKNLYKTNFCYGGISLEEMIVPLAVLKGK